MNLLLSPLFGGLIGYTANRLAVKMVFWPAKPIMVFGRRLPMTPGMFVARRREFAHAFAEELVTRFLAPRDIVRSLGQALDAGLEEQVLRALPPAAARIAETKLEELTPEDVRVFSFEVSKFIRESGMVSTLVTSNVEAMTPTEVEKMVRQVCGKELRAMAMFDAAIGGLVGLLQGLVAYLLS